MRLWPLAVISAAVIAAYVVGPSPQPLPPEPTRLAGHAVAPVQACTVSNFQVEDFTPRVVDDCRLRSCPVLKLLAHLKNNCAVAAGAQVKVVATDQAGNLVDTFEGWPASTRNIAPGEAYAFDFGPVLTYRKSMKNFSLQVIDAKVWGK